MMKQTTVHLPEIRLLGICVRTSYLHELEPLKGAIFPCVQRFFHERLFERIPHRKKPGTTICAYTEYESDYRGAYTYFIGEEVSSFDLTIPNRFSKLIIPAQTYVKFTTSPNPMPQVVVEAWKEIWQKTSEELGGKRSYITDFEIYDERAADHNKIILDVLVGVQIRT